MQVLPGEEKPIEGGTVGRQFGDAFRGEQERQSQARVPESWVGEDVLVLLDPTAAADLVPEAGDGVELTLTLAGMSPHGALLRQGFRDPNSGGTQRVGNIFYPWGSIKRIRRIER